MPIELKLFALLLLALTGGLNSYNFIVLKGYAEKLISGIVAILCFFAILFLITV